MSGGAVVEFAWGGAAGEGVPRHRLADVVAAVAGVPGRRPELIAQCGVCGRGVGARAFALHCTSCGAVLVRESDLTEPVRPDAVLPFAVDRDAARAAFSSWAARRRFAPRALRGGVQIRSVDGVFLPFWVFGAASYSTYVGRRGEDRSRQVMRTRTDAEGRTETYWETEWYTHWDRVTGAVSRVFEGLVVPGCSPLPDKLPQWPLVGLCPFSGGPREGVAAVPVIACDVDPEFGFTRATARMSAQIEDDVRLDIGGSVQQVRDVSTTYDEQSCALLLLPAWLVSYQHGARGWSAFVNGATGEAVGQRPYSGTKISLLVGALALAAAIVTILMMSR